MKTPLFWQERGWKAMALWPLSFIYEQISLLKRSLIRPVKLPVPVVCIGNITAGGAGKTPLALHIGEQLKARGVKAFFISRGYGGKFTGPVVVDIEKHQSHEVGDEPLLLAKTLPTIVAKNRLQAAQLAIKLGAQLVIMDDGFQNPQLFKNFSFLVIDGAFGFGNGLLIPAGPLRERPDNAFKRAHCVVLMNPHSDSVKVPPEKPLLTAKTKPTHHADLLRGKRAIAFCGIAHPQKFFTTLRYLTVNVLEQIAFADHAPYSDKQLLELAHKAHKANAFLVTTAKDAARIPLRFRDKVCVVDIELVFSQSAMLDAQLEYIVGLV